MTNIRIEGLRNYLTRTGAEHNNRGYAEFAHFISEADDLKEKPPKAKMSRAFLVSRPTIDKWILIYREEQAAHD